MPIEIQRARIDVVLVSPRNPLNIGAAARAMANFGFSRLTVVAPFEAHWREAKSAVGAPELLREARETNTLSDALTACTLVVGTGTLTHRTAEQPIVLLPELAPMIHRESDSRGRIALVFGQEKHGLTRDDLALCHVLVTIPTDASQPSMNLGQAVAVCLYELARSGAGRPDRSDQQKTSLNAITSGATTSSAISNATSNATPNATSGALDRLAELVSQSMTAVDYSPKTMDAANRHNLRLLLRRLHWNEADVRRALGLFRRILWRLKHPTRETRQ